MKRESRTVDRSHQVGLHAQRHLPLVDLLVDTRTELMELTFQAFADTNPLNRRFALCRHEPDRVVPAALFLRVA